MTTPIPPNAVSLSAASAVLLGDGEWIVLRPGSLTAVISPTFLDPQTQQQVAPGETWFQFQSTANVTYACPARGILGVQLPVPVVE
jgi:hypothetical protein